MKAILTSRYLNGFIQLVFSSYVGWSWTARYFNQTWGDILYYYMYPKWIMMSGISLGLIGIVIAMLVIKGSVSISKGYVLEILVVTPGILLMII